jgi:hypothetical protein
MTNSVVKVLWPSTKTPTTNPLKLLKKKKRKPNKKKTRKIKQTKQNKTKQNKQNKTKQRKTKI